MNNNKRKLHLYSIMPLDIDHIDEICEDIRLQYETGVASCPLFSCTLVPEGNPPADKASELCEIYAKFKAKLDTMGIPSGILVQATIGHGWRLSSMFPYQQYTNFNNGEMKNTACPTDDGFKEYIRHAFTVIAKHKPHHIMLDDDFRLITFRDGCGCACPEHMRRFNEAAGTSLSREELWQIVSKDHELCEKYTDIMVKVQLESLYETARVMRDAIDAIDPTIPGSYCCVGNDVEGAHEIARIMAGKGHPIVIRINNGNYTAQSTRDLPNSFHRAAHQIAKLKGKADVILAETDTCPQNRYSTGAMPLHSHFTGTILEGAAGAKHWITRLKCHEPQSGKAYRKILGANKGFYEALSEIVPTLEWQGFRIPVSDTPHLNFKTDMSCSASEGWGSCVLERLGLPVYFGTDLGGILCLNGDADKVYSDEEIKKILGGSVFLASDTARNLIRRGFGKYLGVDVREWNGKGLTSEMFLKGDIKGNTTNLPVGCLELVPLSDAVEVDSVIYHAIGKMPKENLFPAVTTFKNELGGTVVTFCGTPVAKYNLVEAFSFLSYSRKKQLISLAKELGHLPVYYPGDEELYFRCAKMQDGGTFCSLINIGIDPIDEIELVGNLNPTKIYKLCKDGTRSEVEFTINCEKITVKTESMPLDPVILFIYK